MDILFHVDESFRRIVVFDRYVDEIGAESIREDMSDKGSIGQ